MSRPDEHGTALAIVEIITGALTAPAWITDSSVMVNLDVQIVLMRARVSCRFEFEHAIQTAGISSSSMGCSITHRYSIQAMQ